MVRLRTAFGLLASIILAAATAAPVMAEPVPPTLTIETTVSHYLGGYWEQQVAFSVSCEGFEPQEVQVDLPGATQDALAGIGPVPAGTTCWIDVSYWPDPGWNAGWEETQYRPGPPLVLGEGENVLSVVMPRIWLNGWPPEDDTGIEHSMDLVIDRVYLNGKGGIEVEGSSWCDAADILTGDFEGDLYANAQWAAWQYVGRKSALQASYDSAIAHPCWVGSDPDHGPYDWQTRYPYPDGSLQWVYAWNGKFGGGSIHVEAQSQTETVIVTQSFAPEGWLSFEGVFVPYDADGVDNNEDGWSVTHHYWFGWDQADLKPIRVK